MRMNIVGKHMDVSDSMRARIQRKLGKLERYFKPDTDAKVVLSVEKNRKIIEVTIFFDGGVLRAEEATPDMYMSLDNVLAKLERQVRKHRTRLEKRLRADAFEPAEIAELAKEEELEQIEAAHVVKTKRFPLKPMTVEEAIMQMELLGHSFFVFFNGDTKQVNVLYTREQGNYGLIEPEYD